MWCCGLEVPGGGCADCRWARCMSLRPVPVLVLVPHYHHHLPACLPARYYLCTVNLPACSTTPVQPEPFPLSLTCFSTIPFIISHLLPIPRPLPFPSSLEERTLFSNDVPTPAHLHSLSHPFCTQRFRLDDHRNRRLS